MRICRVAPLVRDPTSPPLRERKWRTKGESVLFRSPSWLLQPSTHQEVLLLKRAGDCFYLVPLKRYYYWTPKGRRKDIAGGGAKKHTHGHTNAALGARTSPFVSFWYCGGFPSALASRLRAPEGIRIYRSLVELPVAVRAGAVDPRKPAKVRKLGGS